MGHCSLAKRQIHHLELHFMLEQASLKIDVLTRFKEDIFFSAMFCESKVLSCDER